MWCLSLLRAPPPARAVFIQAVAPCCAASRSDLLPYSPPGGRTRLFSPRSLKDLPPPARTARGSDGGLPARPGFFLMDPRKRPESSTGRGGAAAEQTGWNRSA